MVRRGWRYAQASNRPPTSINRINASIGGLRMHKMAEKPRQLWFLILGKLLVRRPSRCRNDGYIKSRELPIEHAIAEKLTHTEAPTLIPTIRRHPNHRHRLNRSTTNHLSCRSPSPKTTSRCL